MKEYRFPPTSGFVRFITTIIIVAAIALCAYIYLVYVDLGGYITASVAGIMLAIILLQYFALPKKIRIGEDYVEIVCTLKLVRISLNEITEVSRVAVERQKKYIPLWSLYGTFGYTGWFRNRKLVRLYATRLSNLIEIKTNRSRTYVISAIDPESMVKIIKTAAGKN